MSRQSFLLGLFSSLLGWSSSPLASSQSTPSLTGLSLRYLIGRDSDPGVAGKVTVIGYDGTLPKYGIGVKYCNLFDEQNTGEYGPYLDDSDTAKEYSEGQIDPQGPGWEVNAHLQMARAKAQGFSIIELDNPDAYRTRDVLRILDLTSLYDLKVLAKNPELCDDPIRYLSHSSVVGAVVEANAGTRKGADVLRQRINKIIPFWFISFDKRYPEYTQDIAFPAQ